VKPIGIFSPIYMAPANMHPPSFLAKWSNEANELEWVACLLFWINGWQLLNLSLFIPKHVFHSLFWLRNSYFPAFIGFETAFGKHKCPSPLKTLFSPWWMNLYYFSEIYPWTYTNCFPTIHLFICIMDYVNGFF
jgi:hypothetical protein